MRAWIASDIHASPIDIFGGSALRVPDADICICAGDVSNNVLTSIDFLQREIEPHMPVILVLGNHDFFDSSIEFTLEKARSKTDGANIHLLENQSIEITGCRFVGATLWTDFAVAIGGDEHIPPEERRAKAFEQFPLQMADFHAIFQSDARREAEGGLITAREILERHLVSRSYIDHELSKPFDGPTVVLTHHAPLPESFDPDFFGQVTNAAYASDLSDLIALRKPSHWIHGHIHKFRDYMAHKTRVICNPRGYSRERDTSGFRPDFVIDL